MPTVASSALGRPLVRVRGIFDYTEINAAATTQTIDLFTVPANAIIQDVFIEIPTLLADAGSISAVTLKIGNSGDDDAYFTATSVFTGGTQTRQAAAGAGPLVLAAQTTVQCVFTATGANFGDGSTSDLDAGQVVVTMTYRIV
jgi:hypothetical protein